ncbi:MAG: ATP-binding protein [Armatimonadetes bacterium]|nr:ATP-binding protein [Armatimonadota bacterium]
MDSSTPSPPSRTETERIQVTIPARPEYVVVVRLVVAGIAGRMPFSVDDIEDLKLAVGEACTVAILAGAPQVEVGFDVAPDQLEVHIAYRQARGGRGGQERELATFLVRCLMDDVRFESRGTQRMIRMTKRVPREQNGAPREAEGR